MGRGTITGNEENHAIIKVITQHTREYNALQDKYNSLAREHARLLDEMTSIKLTNQKLRKEKIVLKAKIDQLKMEASKK